MPDYQFSYCEGRASELEQFRSGASDYTMRTSTAFVKKEKSPSVIDTLHHLPPSPDAKGCHTDRGFNAEMGDFTFQAGQSPKKSRGKETSKHFGVRFRPDLQKYVAEIRVAEWKTVDKKVWLGTFDSEEGAARAVDAARKLLKCKKKRPPNFPCESLTAYSEKIPSNLNLNNIREDSMFKEVTQFVKRKAQEYAASFCPNRSTACISISTEQLHAKYNEFALPEDDMACYGTSNGSSYHGQWATYCSTTSSSAGTSPDDQKASWLYVDSYRAEMPQIEEQSVEGDWTTVDLQPASASHVWEGQNSPQFVLPDHTDQIWLTDESLLASEDFLFPNDDDQFFADQTAMDVDEMPYMESQNQTYSTGEPSMAEWMTQQNLNAFHSLMSSSMELVC